MISWFESWYHSLYHTHDIIYNINYDMNNDITGQCSIRPNAAFGSTRCGRLWRETANPRPGFLGNPIVKANLKQLLCCLCFPINAYITLLLAGPRSSRRNRTRVSLADLCQLPESRSSIKNQNCLFWDSNSMRLAYCHCHIPLRQLCSEHICFKGHGGFLS